MVRLKVAYGIDVEAELTLFQFQYGTIKSKLEFRLQRRKFCFNSNMVRLKVSTQTGAYLLCWCFNSNMVRLKVLLSSSSSASSTFQFQYGTIKSVSNGTLKLIFEVFQFQYGTIKSRNYLIW